MSTPLPRYVVFGEALTDMVRQADGSWLGLPGGSCWNVARVGARLGIATAFAGAVSQDLFGDDLARASADAGLDGRFLQRVARSPFLAFVASRHPPQYFFVGDDSADLHFDPARLPEGWRQAAEVIHFGSISLVRQPLAARLCEEATLAATAGKRIAFDPNFRDLMRAPGYANVLAHMLRLASYVKISDEDLAGLFPALDTDAALAQVRAMAPDATVMLTRGAHGMTLLKGSIVVEQPALAVDVADTVGCGDAAMGGWMAGVLSGAAGDLAAQARLAAAAAAIAATRAGAYPPRREEVEELLAA
ncbi:fructokinase FrcK [Cupriavidus necator N-1]|uniref:Fructokinase FrcK n=1 Tax=Cupriavidus necator (strain ATCC 43291 / DSM 13513 / CCUG 52238 / LMG 8453 / N-1) TaxID=1042878 RepID=F8GP97_CUPNN|nr:carbohydrate kinase [Cupriavidus necator]AEI80465.1 fructokinase FrcK [Cupriavidus necator N-1]MDX6009909.1 carbohydrate kinase [Cupriavidus necator]